MMIMDVFKIILKYTQWGDVLRGVSPFECLRYSVLLAATNNVERDDARDCAFSGRKGPMTDIAS